MRVYFNDVYRKKRILITGHTGFKGSWLSFWLEKLGARVCGYSLPAPTRPSHYNLLKFPHKHVVGDIRNARLLKKTFDSFSPDMVIHMAAQPLVRVSYAVPQETFDINVLGTVNVLEACRKQPSISAILVVTSDKCYENMETRRAYRETDPLGGRDPYSASKGCAEVVASSYRRVFFGRGKDNFRHPAVLASVRAGNAIGGGDWAKYRIIPDLMRAASRGKSAVIRNPHAMRPWQHVLDALSGYLLLGQKLFEGDAAYMQAWNFGPDPKSLMSVATLVSQAHAVWPRIKTRMNADPGHHEADLLILDSSKARRQLSWEPIWPMQKAVEKTVSWYQRYYEAGSVETGKDLEDYGNDAFHKNAVWAKLGR